jgi:hypothetical protein
MSDPISRLEVCRREIDRVFGDGHAVAHPEVLVAVMQSAASDWAAARLAAVALLVEEEESISKTSGNACAGARASARLPWGAAHRPGILARPPRPAKQSCVPSPTDVPRPQPQLAESRRSTNDAMCRFCCKKILRIRASIIDSRISRQCEMLIQKFSCPDSIVAFLLTNRPSPTFATKSATS